MGRLWILRILLLFLVDSVISYWFLVFGFLMCGVFAFEKWGLLAALLEITPLSLTAKFAKFLRKVH